MSKFQKVIFGVFLLLIALMVYAEATKAQPINWFPSYAQIDKIPFGTYVLHDALKQKLGKTLEDVSISPFEKLRDSNINGTYLFINTRIDFDETELNNLLDWVSNGNTMFIAAYDLGSKLRDTLQVDTKNHVYFDQISSKPLLNLVNKNLKAAAPYLSNREMKVVYFDEIDTLQHRILGVSQTYRDALKITNPHANFIEAPFGAGTIYLHTQPEVFTNYFLLEEDNNTYTEKVLSYLDTDQTVFWDMHYKAGKRVNTSPLFIILNSKSLKWAYYSLWIGGLLFVFFEGKRKQRAIPMVPQLTNRTYAYTRTIAGMYIDKKENHQIALKQISLFFEHVRTRLRIPTAHINLRFLKAVAAGSGNTLEDTQKLFTFIEKVQNQEDTVEAELIKLYTDISTFKNTPDGKS